MSSAPDKTDHVTEIHMLLAENTIESVEEAIALGRIHGIEVKKVYGPTRHRVPPAVAAQMTPEPAGDTKVDVIYVPAKRAPLPPLPPAPDQSLLPTPAPAAAAAAAKPDLVALLPLLHALAGPPPTRVTIHVQPVIETVEDYRVPGQMFEAIAVLRIAAVDETAKVQLNMRVLPAPTPAEYLARYVQQVRQLKPGCHIDIKVLYSKHSADLVTAFLAAMGDITAVSVTVASAT